MKMINIPKSADLVFQDETLEVYIHKTKASGISNVYVKSLSNNNLYIVDGIDHIYTRFGEL